ncbi:mevalonate kinase [archaeon BMS3Abin16]|nr:mevalonate kinase [archaeon BMS3Abin16]HDY74475.1 mevalonate kinase [Euryarchaeota archaeon]
MVTASAPGKVILFGEHAVVYGEPAIAAAINRRIYVSVEKRSDDEISVTSGHALKGGYPYVTAAVELTFEFLGRCCGLDVKVDSEFPPASGLGSSAAVSVATILATASLLGGDVGKKDLARLGHQVERRVQGAASITDSSVTTFGGVLFIKPGLEVVERIDSESLPLVVGYTGVGGSTKEQVEKVRVLRESYPDVVGPIIHTIGRLTLTAKKVLQEGGEIGGLMNINHGLLESLGVGTDLLSKYVYAARDAGAAGAKITGAGGGGCMVAYAPGRQDEVARALSDAGGLAMKVSVEGQGVRVERK